MLERPDARSLSSACGAAPPDNGKLGLLELIAFYTVSVWLEAVQVVGQSEFAARTRPSLYLASSSMGS
jgi:hypothetical protein